MHCALSGTFTVVPVCPLVKQRITEGLNSPMICPWAFMLHWLHYHLLDIKVTHVQC